MTRSRTLRLITCLFVGAAVSTLAGCSSSTDAADEAKYLAYLDGATIRDYADEEILATGYQLCEGGSVTEEEYDALTEDVGLIDGTRIVGAAYLSLCPGAVDDLERAQIEEGLSKLDTAVAGFLN